MARSDKVPAGKVRVYYYVKKSTKQFLELKSKLAGLSESKILDLIVDRVKTRGEKVSLEV